MHRIHCHKQVGEMEGQDKNLSRIPCKLGRTFIKNMRLEFMTTIQAKNVFCN